MASLKSVLSCSKVNADSCFGVIVSKHPAFVLIKKGDGYVCEANISPKLYEIKVCCL